MQQLLADLAPQAALFMLIATRLSAMLAVAPVFSSRMIPVRAKAGLVILVSYIALPVVAAEGGTVPDGPGFFYPVTLLTAVTPEMTACREETFGPVAAVLSASDAEQALAIANDTRYGLAASVWTSAERGEAMARQIQAGQVAVNGIVKTDPRLPSGGVKRSGYGRELGRHGIHEFVNAQQVWVGPKRG